MFCDKINNKKYFNKIGREAKGSAMILTMFILAGMLIVAMSGAYIVLLGITASNTQAQSAKAYFAAEAGIEFVLWNVRRNGADYGIENINSGAAIAGPQKLSDNIAEYSVFHTAAKFLHTYTSVGSFINTKRSVEASF